MNIKNTIKELRTFLILWSTQSLSQLGSAMTNFALTLWLYQKTGSALQTALLSVCSYAPYVLLSIFAGAFSDRWDKKKVMLFSDLSAAFCTVIVLLLLMTDSLRPAHMYLLNAVNGLMNTVQQPAGDVAMTLITPVKHYQKTSGMRSLSNSLVTILNPVFATALFALAGLEAVIYTDLATFGMAFVTLLLFVEIPAVSVERERLEERFSDSVKTGLAYLRDNRLILVLILFLAAVNFVASAFDAVLPAFILPRENGGIPVKMQLSAAVPGGLLRLCFGSGKGSGAAMMMCILGILGTGICLGFGRILSRYSYEVSEKRCQDRY